MNLLAIDSCEARGSVALLRDGAIVQVIAHETGEDYSSWLLPAVGRLLEGPGLGISDVEIYAVATGPGSFTGLRVGLTTVKAWSEVYGRRIAGVSRLKAIAGQGKAGAPLVAAFAEAQRGQMFGALYRRRDGVLERIEDEIVIAPAGYVEYVCSRAEGQRVCWVSTDAEGVRETEEWRAREKTGERIEQISAVLAGEIGKIGDRMALGGELTDALGLDANYVRRSDAEIFWKGAGSAAVKRA